MAYYCQPCNRSFGGQHQLDQHRNSPTHNVNCEDFGRTFGSPGALEQHLNSPAHVPDPVYECLECNKSFGGPGALEQHLNSPAHFVERKARPIDHINDFFAAYPDFNYKKSQPIWKEFDRLCDDFGWDNNDYDMREARRNFQSAMVQQFNSLYGTDEGDLNSWQRLCSILNIRPVPEGLKKCRERVRQTHVNLVDLVDTPRTGEEVQIFANLKQLRDYTVESEKFFPMRDAIAGGLLRFLLRQIL